MSRRWVSPLLGAVALIAAFVLSFVADSKSGLDVSFDLSTQAQAVDDRGAFDLRRMAVLQRVVMEVNESYVEPERIDHQRMFLAGINAIQRSVAPVIVHAEEGAATVDVQVFDAHQAFGVSDIDSPWALTRRFREVFEFLQTQLQNEDIDLPEVEYAAVNGMLRTLDPHTILLTPEVFREMRMNTRGEFQGVGILITIRDGYLTASSVMPDTPASRGGLLDGDRIVKIEDESTLNMPLNEAVERLRGPPGSPVNVWIQRKVEDSDRWGAPFQVQLTRARVRIHTVEHRMLPGNIGYISISSFADNTHEDVLSALTDLHRQELRGLVLDLRDNPGGLLDQAVEVSDTFLTSGTIVSTSSPDPRQRDERVARAPRTEPDYPMVVLINGGSASASEIVAGALKNNDRALIVGQRSFGKGSVQILEPFRDESALKLTIAQYLTPGHISIQGVGIVPDIGIDPMTIDAEDMDLAVDPEVYLRESDLRSHLTSERALEQARPSAVLRYYLNRDMRQRVIEGEQPGNDDEDEFLTRFSAKLLAHVTTHHRGEMLEQAASVIEESAAHELQLASDELARLGVDWSAGPDQGPTELRVEVSTEPSGDRGVAGQALSIRVRVTNEGDAPVYRLRASTVADYQLFDDRELVFGRVNPGETKEWTTTLGTCSTQQGERVCQLPPSVSRRADGIRVEFDELHDHIPEPAELRLEVQGLPLPRFAYSLNVEDDLSGNGDGLIQRGEQASITMRVRNVGEGPSMATHANLRNLSGRGVLLRDGRFRIDNMAPGEERVVRFTFEVLQDFEQESLDLEVSVIDADIRESVSEKIHIALSPPSQVAPRSGQARVAAQTEILDGPSADAAPIARATGALRVEQIGQVGEFVRVRLNEDEVGWVPQSALHSGSGDPRAIAWVIAHESPAITIQEVPLVTRSNRVRIQGVATDVDQVSDVYIFAGVRKVFYTSGRAVEDPTQLSFDAEIPLHAGTNYVSIFARQSDQVIARHLLVIRRDGAEGQLLETPRYDDELFGSVESVEE